MGSIWTIPSVVRRPCIRTESVPQITTANHSTLCEEKTMSRYFRNFVAGSLALFSLGSQAQQNFDNVEIEVLPVRDGIYMLVGAGGYLR